MIPRIIFASFLLFIGLSCVAQTSVGEQQTTQHSKQFQPTPSGLSFERGMNRGSGYVDSTGKDYSLRYTPIYITNDSTIPIHIELAFLKRKGYTAPNGLTFKIIPLPSEWTQNGSTDSMMHSLHKELPNIINMPIIHETINPGEKIALAIGTLVIKPREVSINLDVPFAHTESGKFPTCDWLLKKNPTSEPSIELGIKLDINQSCLVIPCGHISYPE